MTIQIGNYSLCLAVLVGAMVLLLSLASIQRQSPQFLSYARRGMLLFAGLITTASAMLMIATINTDFRLDYVTHYTERALPLGYKLAAFWAGQEGSLLLWAWLLAVLSVIAVFLHRAEAKEKAFTLAALAVVCSFFAALILFAANPFKLAEVVAADGHGLNPMLQDPGMIAHPPMLFLGYAGFTIPFALMVGALLSGRKDHDWLKAVRWWSVASWLFLSVGILLGAQWAYVELGWGGYWAWDPVENASLLPWLTGTALLHTVMVQQQRGMLKGLNAALIAVTFILCIFGTYLTRSGVVQSVHSFGESLIGTFFLIFLAITVLASVGLIFARRRDLQPEQKMETVIGREGAFLATGWLLIVVTVITLIGTIFPLISGIFMQQGISVSQSFYNTTVGPVSLLLAALMATGPLLRYGKNVTSSLVRNLTAPVIVAIAVTGWLWIRGIHNGWALVAGFIAAAAVVVITVDFVRSAWIRAAAHHENLFVGALRLVDGNHRRYGGQVTHVGVLMLIIGVVGSSQFSVKENFELKAGQSAVIGGYTLTLQKLEEVRRENYSAVQALVNFESSDGIAGTLIPQRRFYDKSEESSASVAITSTWREDLYVTLAGWEQEGGRATVQAIVNPLVSWIWIGGIVLTAGGMICLIPRIEPHHQPQPAMAPVEAKVIEHKPIETKSGKRHGKSRKQKVRQ